jgi:hypothetical protein
MLVPMLTSCILGVVSFLWTETVLRYTEGISGVRILSRTGTHAGIYKIWKVSPMDLMRNNTFRIIASTNTTSEDHAFSRDHYPQTIQDT